MLLLLEDILKKYEILANQKKITVNNYTSASLVGLVVGVVYLCTGSWRRAHIKGVPETVS